MGLQLPGPLGPEEDHFYWSYLSGLSVKFWLTKHLGSTAAYGRPCVNTSHSHTHLCGQHRDRSWSQKLLVRPIPAHHLPAACDLDGHLIG